MMENRPKQQRLFQDDEDSDTDQEPLYPFTISDEDSWLRRHYLEFLNSLYKGPDREIESPLWQDVVEALVIILICSAGTAFLVGFILLVVSSEPGDRIRTETVNWILKLAAMSGAVFGMGFCFFSKYKYESSKSEAEHKDEK